MGFVSFGDGEPTAPKPTTTTVIVPSNVHVEIGNKPEEYDQDEYET